MRVTAKLLSIVLSAGFFLFVSSSAVSAATIYVNSTTGDDVTGDGSSSAPYQTFHKAYTEAVDTDTIDLTDTFTWTDAAETGDLATTGYTISKNLTIQGQSAPSTIVQAAETENTADRRVFTIAADKTVVIQDVTIRHGRTTFTGNEYYGGGIKNNGTLTVQRATITRNRATGSGGGGLSNAGSNLTVRDSTITYNYGYYMGGGILNEFTNGSGTLDVINSTIAHNVQTATLAYTEGAGVYFRNGSGSITNCTIMYNDGDSTSGLGLGHADSVVCQKLNYR